MARKGGILLLASLALPAHAQFYFDVTSGSGLGTASGTSNSWNSTIWNNADSSGNSAREAWTNGSLALFNAGSGTYGVDITTSGTTVSGVTVSQGNVTISKSGSGTLAMSGNSNFNVVGNLTVSAPIGGAFSLTKIGTGTLTFTGANTYTGSTTIGSSGGSSGGTLAIGSGGSLPNTTLTIYAGTFDLGSNSDTIGALTMGGGAAGTTAAVTGTGTLSLGGNVTYTATNNPQGATISSALSLNGSNRTFTINDSSNASYDLTVSGVISNGSGNRRLTKAGNGTLRLTGNNTYTGPTVITAGTISTDKLAAGSSASGIGQSSNSASNLVLNNGTLQYTGAAVSTNRLFQIGQSTNNVSGTLDASGSGAVSFTNTGSLTFGNNNQNRTLVLTGTNTGDNTLASTIGTNGSGTVAVTKSGNGTWVLSGTNSYTGATTINLGTLKLGNASALGSTTGGTLVNSGGALDLNGTTVSNAEALSLTGTGVSSTGALTNSGAAGSYAGAITLTGNTSIGGSGNITLSGAIGQSGGARTLTKTGANTLTLTNANTFTGGLTVSAGTLVGQSTSVTDLGGFRSFGDYSGVAVDTTVITVASGATLAVSSVNNGGTGSSATTQYQTMSLNGTGSDGNGALQSLAGNNTWTGNITLAGNTTIGNRAATGDADTLFLGPYVAPSPTYLKLNNNRLTFTGSGDVYISSAIGNSGGSDTGGVDISLSNASGAGSIYFGGTQNFYTGSTNVNQGTLELLVNPGDHRNAAVIGALNIGNGSGNADSAIVRNYYSEQILDTVAVVIKSDGKLDLGTYSVNEYLSNLSLQGGHISTGTGNLYLGRDSAYQTNVSSTVTVTTAAVSTIDGNLHLNNTGGSLTRTFDVASGSTLMVNANIFGGDYTKSNAGTMIVTSDSATNGYTGKTTVAGGILNIRNSGALGGADGAVASGTVVADGATLQLEKATNLAVGAEYLMIQGSGVGGIGAVNNKAGTNTWAGTVRLDANATIKADTGTSMEFTGGVTGSAGTGVTQTLTVGGAGNTIISSAIQDNRNTVSPFNDLHTGTVAISKVDTGTLTLSGANTFKGAINITGGTVAVTKNAVLGGLTNAVSVGSGTTFALSGGSVGTPYSNTIGELTGSGLVTIAANTTLVVNNTAADSFAGRLSGNGLFEKSGSQTFTFTSAGNTSAFNFAGTVQNDTGVMEFQGGTAGNALTIGTLNLLGGELLLTGAYINVGTLNITGNTILDFGTSGASILNATNIYIAAGVHVTVRNWTSEVDYLFANSDFRQNNASGQLSIYNQIGTTAAFAPENQVWFENTNSTDGSHTTWTNNDYYAPYANKQIRPVPEPSTYGACLLAACLGLLAWKRFRKSHPVQS